jgi:hypothetical protein
LKDNQVKLQEESCVVADNELSTSGVREVLDELYVRDVHVVFHACNARDDRDAVMSVFFAMCSGGGRDVTNDCVHPAHEACHGLDDHVVRVAPDEGDVLIL